MSFVRTIAIAVALLLGSALHARACETAATCAEALAALPAAVRQDHVFFVDGGSALSSEARVQLDRLADALKTPLMRDTCLRLVGHADIGGDADYNLALGRERAEAVARYLLTALPLGSMWIETGSAGEMEPMTSHPATHLLQRRVEISARRCNA
ncbi:MAG: OmpA family protein [Shimia sp.]